VRSAALEFLNDDVHPTTKKIMTSTHIYQSLLTAQPTLASSAVVAGRYLSVPATSVESERLGDCNWASLISKLRMRLLPDNVEMLVFLNKNG